MLRPPTATTTTVLAVLLLLLDQVRGFSPVWSVGRTVTPNRACIPATSAKSSSNDDADDDDEMAGSGAFDRAMRQLGDLGSLVDNDDDNKPTAAAVPSTKAGGPRQLEAPSMEDMEEPGGVVSPEQEMKLYKDLFQELEEKSEEDMYSTVLQDMGGVVTTDSTRGKGFGKPQTTTTPPMLDDASTSGEVLNQALMEAMKEVNVKNPSAVDSILDDKELMNEIEAIFERGNEQLIAGLEEVRREQKQLAEASMAQQQQKIQANDDADSQARLAAAEQTMSKMLDQVKAERANVEQAVADLKAAQEEEDAKASSSNVLLQLKTNPLKQGALIGLVLFSFRSLVDSVTALSDESAMPAALLQGGLAVACAIAFKFL